MHTKENVYLKDKVANILFTDKETREFTESVIAASLDIPKSIVKDNLVLLTPRVNSSIKTQYSEVDALYENNTVIINIEVNYSDYETLDDKNMKYVCHLLLNQFKINGKYPKLKPIYQICINNFDRFKKNKFIYKSSLIEESLHIKRNDFISIIDINMDFLRNMDYTKIMEVEENSLERLLYVFICRDKRILDKLYAGDDIMDKVREKMSALTEDVLDELYYDREELFKITIAGKSREEGIKEGIKQGIKQGIEQGENKQKLEIAKAMLKDNVSDDIILKYTGISMDELNNLKK